MNTARVKSQKDGLPDNLLRVMAVVGVVFFIIYLVTLSSGVYPGISATWVSSAMGFRSWETASHPIWRFFVSFWRHIPLGGAVWRLNLSSALFGAVSAALLCRYAAYWVYTRISIRTEEDGVTNKVDDEPDEDALRENRVFSRVAVASGVCAAVLFGTGVAGWSAATQFRPETLDLALVLTAFLLYQDYTRKRGVWRLYALALLCGAGCAETVMFWVATLFLVIALVAFLYRHHRLRFGLCAGLIAAGVMGLAVYVLSARAFVQTEAMATGNAVADWQPVLKKVLQLQLKEARFFLPPGGWILVLAFQVVPWTAFQLGYWIHLHRKRDFRADALLFICLIVVFLLQFGVPVPPWPMWRNMGRMPMLEGAIAALLGGWACAYWVYGLLIRWEPDKLIAGRELRNLEKSVRQKRGLSLGVCLLLAVLTVCAALTNVRRAGGWRGRFADVCAREVLDHLNGRTWLVTNGILDPNLAALAAAGERTLHLVDLTRDRDDEQIRRLRAWVEDDPRLSQYRERLVQAAGLGAGAFLREWLIIDPRVEDSLALYVMPSFWSTSGLISCPDRFLFHGIRSDDTLRSRPFLAEHRPFWERMRKLMPRVEKVREPADAFRRALRGHLSMAANDLGVLLLDLGREEEAFEAFDESLLLEPDNLSALGNQLMLTGKGVRPVEKMRVEQNFKNMISDIKGRPMTFDVVRRYGQIRSPEALTALGAIWGNLGQYDFAVGNLQRAADLEKEGAKRDAILAYLGKMNVKAGETEKGEEVFHTLLTEDPDNIAAIMGLLNLTLQSGNESESRKWIARARKAGADPSALTFAEARADIAGSDYESARERLLNLTDKMPRNLDAWALLAASMIHLKKLDDVEHTVLPKMEKIIGKQPNALIYQVRGDLARARGPASYDVARKEYRRALRLSPGRLDLLTSLVDLDLSLQDQVSAGRDAADLLRIDPDNPVAHYVLGTQAIIRGEQESAEMHLRACVMRGEAVEALNNLAGLLAKKGSLEEAEIFARQAVEKAGGNTAVLDTLADVLLKREKIDEALKVIGQARALAPDDWLLAFTEARVFMAADRKEEARALLNEVRTHIDSLPPYERSEVNRITQEWRSRR